MALKRKKAFLVNSKMNRLFSGLLKKMQGKAEPSETSITIQLPDQYLRRIKTDSDKW